MRGAWLTGLVMASVAACATGYDNGGPPSVPGPPAAGAVVATDAPGQAARGEKLYAENCGLCHGDAGEGGVTPRGKVPAIVGPFALPRDPLPGATYRKQPFQTARDLYEFVKTYMPPGMGNTLPEADYLDIVVFDLKANGVAIGTGKLTPDALSRLGLHPPSPQARR